MNEIHHFRLVAMIKAYTNVISRGKLKTGEQWVRAARNYYAHPNDKTIADSDRLPLSFAKRLFNGSNEFSDFLSHLIKSPIFLLYRQPRRM